MRDEISPFTRALHLAALTAFAVSQPLFDLLRQYPTFLIAHGADRLDAALLALGLGLLLPVGVGAAAAAVSKIAGSAGRIVHLAFVALGVALIALPLAKQMSPGLAPALAVAVAAGCLGSFAYARVAVMRSFASVLALVLAIFPATFALSGEIRGALAPLVDVASAQVVVERPTPVVVVVFDALALFALVDEHENIDAKRYPNFAALARDAIWFRNASTVAEKTRAAIPAILTGRYPEADLPPSATHYPANLFTMLSASHEVHALEPVTRLCPASLCGERATRAERLAAIARDLRPVYLRAILPEALLEGVPEVSRTWRSFTAPGGRVTERDDLRGRGAADAEWLLDRFLEAMRAGSRPGLYFAHFQVPHWPYRYLPSGASYDGFGRHTTPQYDDSSRWRQPLYAEANALAPYLLQVAYVDRMLGRIVSHMREVGLYDEAALVVLSDHGMGFKPGVHPRVLEPESVADIVPVPLFIKPPALLTGSVSERNVETIDVLPTLLDVLGARTSHPLDGVSLLDPNAPRRDGKRLFMHRRGETRHLDYPSQITGRSDTAVRASQFFDLSDGTNGLFAVASARDVLGRSIDSLSLAPVEGLRFRLDHSFGYENVEPASGFVPAFVSGELELPRNHTRFPIFEVLVAVNGVVRGATRPFDRDGRTARFETLVPASSFEVGNNRIDVLLEIVDGETRTHLRAEPERSPTWRVIANRSGRAALLLTPQGRLLPVRPGAVRGSVARVRIDFRGEAFADSVLLFSGGEFLAEQRSGGASPMKFEFPVPFTMGSGEADDAVQRFVAIDGFVASEIVGSWREDVDAPWSGEPARLSWSENDGQPEIALSTGERIAVDGSIDAVQRGAVLTFVDGKFEGLDVFTESRRVGEPESEASEKHSALLSEDGLLFRIAQ